MARVLMSTVEEMLPHGIVFDNVNYSGHVFDEDYFIAKSNAEGPGWYIFGRNAEKYGRGADGSGAYIMLVARPNLPPRAHKHYNNKKIKRGWRRKLDAKIALAAIIRHEWAYKKQEEKALKALM